MRGKKQVSVLDVEQNEIQTGICTCTVVLLYLGGVGDLRAAARMHA